MHTDERKYWEESQRIEENWLWILLLGMTFSVAGVMVMMGAVGAMPWPAALGASGSFVALDLGVFWLLRNMRLHLSLTRRGIHYQLWPMERRAQVLSWEEIAQIHIRKTPYMGYGKKYRLNYGMQYIMAPPRMKGLEFQLKNGKKLFLSTRQPDGFRHALQKVGITVPVIET